jgi:hypothetical protein
VYLPPPHLGPGGGNTLACGGGDGGGPNSDRGTEPMVLYVYSNPSTTTMLLYQLTL